MIIDQGHRQWIVVTMILFLVSTGLYVVYANNVVDGPSGGSWQGLLFGITGSVLMLYAGSFSLRKKMPWWRSLGTSQFWLKGHIWLGLLSVPLILFHAGFGVGGLLEQILLALVAVIILSGIFGLILQHYLPRMFRTTVPKEATYAQIPHVCQALRKTADGLIAETCGPLLESPAKSKKNSNSSDNPTDNYETDFLKDFYLQRIRPFLDSQYQADSQLSNPSQAEAIFDQVRNHLSAEFDALLDKLLAICDERRQLATQIRMHHWLHGWLMIHVPLSMALLVLGIAHSIMSLYY